MKFGQYEVPRRADGTLLELGRGGMGITYRAFDTKLRVEVVLKLIHPHLLTDERIQRLFLREARAAAKVRHPNIAAVVNLHDAPPFYYAMEFVQGKSLSNVVAARGGSLPVAEALDYADQVAAALGAMSRERIVHRDLKPTNLMLVHDDDRPFGHIIKVIDFGLAKGFNVDGEADVETHLSSSLSQAVFSGTPYYASPEQCATEPMIDTRSDLYSLGIILWEMLTGKRPFTGQLGQVLSMHQTKEPPWDQLTGLPESVVDILHRLLAKDRKDRFQTPKELRDAIAQCAGSMETVFDGRRRARSGAELSGDDSPTLVATETIQLGSTLAQRFRLGAEISSADGSRLYKAADNHADDRPVALKLLPNPRVFDPTVVSQIERQLAQMREHPHAVVLGPATDVMRSGSGVFFTREWAEGFSLLELIKARGELAAPEVWRLLKELPGALDHASAHQFTLAEPLLRKIFVCPPAGAVADDSWMALRAKPVDTWPEFRLRWNAVSVPPPTSQIMTISPATARAVSASEDPAAALAVLVRVLLGGSRSVIGSAQGAVGVILARALAPGGGTQIFGSAQKLWDALLNPPSNVTATASASAGTPAEAIAEGAQKIWGTLSEMAAKVVPPTGGVPAPGAPAVPPVPPVAAGKPAKPAKAAPAKGKSSGFPVWLLVLLGILAFFALFKSSDRSDTRKTTADKEASTVTVAKETKNKLAKEVVDQVRAARDLAKRIGEETRKGGTLPVVPAPPPVPGMDPINPVSPPEPPSPVSLTEPFSNGIGMDFVPVPGVNGLVAVWKTRVVDFQAYAEGAPYEQSGGIHVKRAEPNDKGGFVVSDQLDPAASWKSPGFKQASDHPVVGVSWKEARAFCEWLTERDRREGRIKATQSYRLPTDAEWTILVGKAKFPWGDDWPPARAAGNYFDASGAERMPGFGAPAPFDDGFPFTSPVEDFEPSKLGLHDVGGNAWELCEDEYRPALNDEDARKEVPSLLDERAIDGTPLRIVRGGSWATRQPLMMRSSYRGRVPATYRDNQIGFRVVLAGESR
ncbi:hypothetical protein AYO41_00035 [Verrucomicrobia bacterium SCGC AG-212-E04]|nr:hypothetical protein AYO41_00035 [Verrucomicrobia bacterium SCGC AG-212-E04]